VDPCTEGCSALEDHLVEPVTSGDQCVVGERGVGRPGELQRTTVAVQPEAVDAVPDRACLGREVEPGELGEGTRRQGVAAGLELRGAATFHHHHVVAVAGEVDGEGRSGRSAADDQDVGGAAHPMSFTRSRANRALAPSRSG
jgi:hypothetical protein